MPSFTAPRPGQILSPLHKRQDSAKDGSAGSSSDALSRPSSSRSSGSTTNRPDGQATRSSRPGSAVSFGMPSAQGARPGSSRGHTSLRPGSSGGHVGLRSDSSQSLMAQGQRPASGRSGLYPLGPVSRRGAAGAGAASLLGAGLLARSSSRGSN